MDNKMTELNYVKKTILIDTETLKKVEELQKMENRPFTFIVINLLKKSLSLIK
jgi:hypothetical protein